MLDEVKVTVSSEPSVVALPAESVNVALNTTPAPVATAPTGDVLYVFRATAATAPVVVSVAVARVSPAA